MAKFIRGVFNNDTLNVCECNDGYWVYDKIQKYNIVMRAKTEQDAFVEAILHHQKRLKEKTDSLKELESKVYGFVSQFTHEDED
jgi:hypothetical protein